MSNPDECIKKCGITDEQMEEAASNTQAYIDAYNLREANKMTQVELASLMDVSQNRVSRMENGDLNAMSLDTVRRYVEALCGHITLVADLPTGKVSLA